MEKIIRIGDKEVKISNNVAWVMEYRDQFNKDIMETLMPLIATGIEAISTIVTESGKDSIGVEEIAEAFQGRTIDIMLPLTQLGFNDSIINVFWAMAKAADDTIDPPKKWVRQFEEFPLDVIVPEVGELILKGFASSKNLERLKVLGKSLAKDNQPTKRSK